MSKPDVSNQRSSLRSAISAFTTEETLSQLQQIRLDTFSSSCINNCLWLALLHTPFGATSEDICEPSKGRSRDHTYKAQIVRK